jgi:hypothetical protein
MSGAARLLVTIVAGLVLVVAASVGLTAAAIHRAGTIEVDVRGSDGNVSVHLPAGLAELVLFFVPDRSLSRIVERHGDPAIADLQRNLPALREAWKGLREAPDFTLVEGHGDGGSFRVQKSGERLLVEVDGGDGRCEVALPLRTVSRALRKI